MKCRASTKVRDRKRQQALTGNMPLTTEPASELEKRVIALIGHEYVEGHDTVPENVPEQEVNMSNCIHCLKIFENILLSGISTSSRRGQRILRNENRPLPHSENSFRKDTAEEF